MNFSPNFWRNVFIATLISWMFLAAVAYAAVKLVEAAT